MAHLPIVVAPDPRLKTLSTAVERIDAAIRTLVEDMAATMYAAPGIGLAAIQVGVPKRIIVVDASEEKDGKGLLRMINPVVVAAAAEAIELEEGCLSFPEFYEKLTRPKAVEVRFTEPSGVERTVAAEGLLARCIQHELDHLEGTLFVDHISALKRNIILRKLSKAKRQKLLKSA
jgi:peptide deformylase